MREDNQAQNYSFINARIQSLDFFSDLIILKKKIHKSSMKMQKEMLLSTVPLTVKEIKRIWFHWISIGSADAADQIIDVETRESDFWIEYNKKFVITQSA